MIVFDTETQNLAKEVGGWGNIEAMRLAVACTWDDRHGYRTWWEPQASDLVRTLDSADYVVGFNVNQFDYRVLSLYGDTHGFDAKTFDVLDEVWRQIGRGRGGVSLGALATRNLGESKLKESGVDAVWLFREGQLEELAAYCQKDVELTKQLYEMWRNQGILWVSDIHYVVWPGEITHHLKELKR